LGSRSQPYPFYNEWIDYSKSYYKFKVGRTGLYRISQPVLASAGLVNAAAEDFQLWRNGKQVPIYTSVSTGLLGAGDFIEFWGEQNDGLPDSVLYRDKTYVLNSKYSLETDTAAFFLTVNPGGNNLRLQNTVNNVAGNSLPAEPYFMYTDGNYFKDYLNPGYYVDAGEFLHSSTYDRSEGWVGWDIYPGYVYTNSHQLYPYLTGPDASFKINISGNSVSQRRFLVKINGDSIVGQQLDYLNFTKAEVNNIPMTLLSTGNANVEIKGQSTYLYDRMVVAQYEIIYPRVFNFAGQNNFKFTLPANAAGNYLEIANFNYGSTAPVLFDITNGKRYIGDISTPGQVKFALEPSAAERNLVLISLVPSNITEVTSLQTRNFINYGLSANQGDYIIISHPVLFTGSNGGNPVENYRAYRSSPEGGGFNAKIYDINELVDQFGLGIKKNPVSVRNFIRWIRTTYPVQPKFVFLVGHATTYEHYRYSESNPDVDKLNLVPTFGSPASDVLLSTEPPVGQIPLTPIGRLSVITGDEVTAYLGKVQQYEAHQRVSSPNSQDKAWMKNIVHVVGGSDPVLSNQLNTYMNKYRQIITDTLFGGKVTTFRKTSAQNVEKLNDQELERLFAEGISQITYFGHSSATVLDFNLDNPDQFIENGKYPFFIALGCLAGNFYNFNPARLYTKETLSEKFILSPDKGSIAFLASSHFGIPHYLDIYTTKLYQAESRTHYGKSYGEILKETIIQMFNQTSQFDFYARLHTEQNTFHGDPALKPNTHQKPDYVVEDPMVKVSPAFISIAETSFKVNAQYLNIGKAMVNEIAVEVKRQYPDGTIKTILKDSIPAIRYSDSITFTVPINPTTDKGLNKIIIKIDADNVVDELFETNNTVTKEVYIFEDDARPVYPLDFAIINKQNIKLLASTANPFSPVKQYRMEIDTTELFNSSFKRIQNITSGGGLLEFSSGFSFTDSTVYYWRVSPLDSQGNAFLWHSASFIYLSNSDLGFNQSHFYQHTKSHSERVYLDSVLRTWKYKPVINNLFIRSGIYPTASSMQADYTVSVNGDNFIGPGCNYNELIINVFDPVSFKPWYNPTGTLYNSSGLCGTRREYNFHYFLSDTMWRNRARNFLDNIVPDGYFVVIRSNTAPFDAGNTYAPVWLSDTIYNGPGNSLYHSLKNQGFSTIDQYDTTRSFIFAYKKNRPNEFIPDFVFSDGIYDRLLLSVNCITPDTLGYTTSPVFGPARQWKQLKWRGASADAGAGDAPTVDLMGITSNGIEIPLFQNLDLSQQDVDISTIDAVQYPNVKLRMRNLDSIYLSPYQMRYWRLTYVPVPEGAIAPNILFQVKDTLEAGEPLDFKLAFKNISESDFDSLRVKMIITDRNNVANVIPMDRYKPLTSGDTVVVRSLVNTATYGGLNTLYVDVNPDNDQPEQFHFNNFLYRNVYVKADYVNPLLDVTFDGVHILNRDLVSSRPHILIKLKDESKWLILNDTAGTTLKVRYPNGVTRPFFFNNTDTLKFTPAGNAPNTDNTATIGFTPHFLQDGEYELIVSGKDRSGNSAGSMEYKVSFEVINKPMISNMLNYPNPFTTSTAFVFTITGNEVPQNIKIEIMTITGKIVREITKEELGPLHIGRNITEFKWDGTDQYGQKLANGIYLYRVVTNLNGKSLEKYKAEGDNTDKYFNKGYGKMYLMR
jgi:hypothetical protein